MNWGGKRQLPSWMLRNTAANQSSISESKGENKENNSELDVKICKPQEEVQRQQDSGALLLESESHLLKKCGARRSKQKSNKQDEVQGDNIDDNNQEKKVGVRDMKRSQLGNELHLLKKCEASGRKRVLNQKGEDHADGLSESDLEKKVNGVARKRRNASRKKQKAKELMEGPRGEKMEHIPSEGELTVEDLVSIAKEYVNAEKDKELQQSKNVGFESDTQDRWIAFSKIESDKDLTGNLGDMMSGTDEQMSSNSPLEKPLHSAGSISNPSNTGDPARDMLDLLLGPLLKKSEEVQRNTDYNRN